MLAVFGSCGLVVDVVWGVSMLRCARGHTSLLGNATASLVLELGHLFCSHFLDHFLSVRLDINAEIHVSCLTAVFFSAQDQRLVGVSSLRFHVPVWSDVNVVSLLLPARGASSLFHGVYII